jgi:hypothetical protein
VIKKPLRKKKIVTPSPPGTTRIPGTWLSNTIANATARTPSNEGMYRSVD